MKAEIIVILVIVAIVGVIAWKGHPTRSDTEGNTWDGKINMPSGDVMVIEYNGHEYLHFITRGVTHNPDCKCMRKKEQ
jgi:hypothetical protein